MNLKTKVNLQIYEEAGDWFVLHREAGLDEAQKIAFDRWLRTSPEHVRAYFEMSATWEDVSSLEAGWNADAATLIARARAADNIVALDREPPGGVTPAFSPAAAEPRTVDKPRRSPAPRIKRLALAASVVMACVVGAYWLYAARNPVYATATGEQKSIALPDGSLLELNARSRVRIRFSPEERAIDLLQGQALFRATQDRARPFVVYADTARIRVLGTRFDVNRKAGGAVITVVEGRVAVTNMALDAPALVLSAGEQSAVARKRVAPPVRIDLATATAWTERHLIFDSAPLTEVAEEFNRYNRRQVSIDDVSLSGFKVSGVFSSPDPGLLIKFLRNQAEIAVVENEEEIRIRRN